VTMRLYKDANANGTLEPGTDTLVGTTTTAADGSYLFSNITPGAAGTDTFFVAATTPAGYSATTAGTVRFQLVAQGGSYVSADFGFLPTNPTFSITDRVWYDANGNGAFAAETGIGGVTVELLDTSLNVIGTTTTASDGTFTFSGLPGGGADYTTRITDTGNVLADYYGTTTFAAARQRAESNLNANVSRAAAPSYGFNFTRSIGDTIWNDLNANGTQDAGEPGMAGITVTLYNDTNNNSVINAGETVRATVVTDSNGQYLFTGLPIGNYIVSVPAQSGYNYVAGGRPDTDAGSAGIQLEADIVGVGNVLTRDFGFQAATPRTVSGKLWNDANLNGVVNGGESGFSGVTVEILSVVAGAGTVAATNGSFTITGTGTNFTVLNPGDPIIINGVTYRVASVASNTSLTLTRSYTGATASGLAWSRAGTPLFTTTTNATGDYTFSGLAAAQHIVRITDTDGKLTGYGATFEVSEGTTTSGNPANGLETVNLTSGNATNINFGYAQLGVFVTLIELRTFDAVQHKKKVTLTWQTAFEADNLGFNVYRDLGGERTQVNKKLIAGSALLTKRNAPVGGYVYRLKDKLPSENSFAQYWLEDVDTHGVRTMHGPFSAAFVSGEDEEDSEDSASLAGLGADGSVIANAAGVGVLRPTTLGAATNAQREQQLELAGDDALKIYVAKEGWQRITNAQMLAAGFDLGKKADKLTLWCEGIEQPMIVNSDSIEFYGLDLDTPSSGARTYWLRANKGGKGDRLEPVNTGNGAPLTGSVPFTYQRIDRSIFVVILLDTGDGENFFGPVITSFGPVAQDLAVANLDASAASMAKLEVTIRGVTEEVPHSVNVTINGHFAGNAVFERTSQPTFTFDIPHSWLVPGANTVTYTALNGEMDINLLVSARLTYQHLLRADDGMFEAQLPASRQVTIGGFPDATVRALDITEPLAPKLLKVTVTPDGATYNATFTTPSGASARTVMVFSSNRAVTDAELEVNRPSNWAGDTKKRTADLVILTHRRFAAAAESLRAARASEGLDAVVVDVDDVYDEYNFGVRGTYPIRSFLQSTQSWKKAPAYVVLIGDASVDPRGYFDIGLVDYLPTRLVPTTWMKTASDGWYADLNADGTEDLMIGRLPARTPEQAATVVNKLASRGTPAGSWSQKALLIADVSDTWNFESSVSSLAGLLPPPYQSSSTIINVGSTPSARDAIQSAMNAGALFVDYVGHGSISLWDHNTMTATDAGLLTNGNKLPFVAGMTCLNNYFHDLFSPSLGEALMNAPNGGAIAVWSSSSLTEPGPQVIMNQELLRHIFGANTTIGQAILRAKAVVRDEDVRRSWNLLGDPTMKLTR
ncbi:MAG TPA: C25 family cysteine peptidase, partial [Thermoanaerobaculia bacterium]|nr:C25 family cysteine peptidase [Thermoanaerobaculia bacterium]